MFIPVQKRTFLDRDNNDSDVKPLGLFGLAAYVAEQHTKEIGIRKVLSASIVQVWLYSSGDFILVAVSCIFATLLAFYYLHDWVQNCAYRVSIGVGGFNVLGIAAIIITLINISVQAKNAALTNPVMSLRSER